MESATMMMEYKLTNLTQVVPFLSPLFSSLLPQHGRFFLINLNYCCNITITECHPHSYFLCLKATSKYSISLHASKMDTTGQRDSRHGKRFWGRNIKDTSRKRWTWGTRKQRKAGKYAGPRRGKNGMCREIQGDYLVDTKGEAREREKTWTTPGQTESQRSHRNVRGWGWWRETERATYTYDVEGDI